MKTDNELIAEFMGWEIVDEMPISKTGIYKAVNPTSVKQAFGKYRSEQMEFNSSWDWLMPAWFKFQNICKELLVKSQVITEYHYHEKIFLDGIKTQDINLCYSALVEGIKWYNSQNS